MTKEEKQLLLKDLCARLPYDVKMEYCGKAYSIFSRPFKSVIYLTNGADQVSTSLSKCKPYLRPMSSMTVEEEYEYHQCKNINYLDICEMEHEEMLKTTALCFSRATDWLNAHHFDYRGLIKKGLALEAPENMYKEI